MTSMNLFLIHSNQTIKIIHKDTVKRRIISLRTKCRIPYVMRLVVRRQRIIFNKSKAIFLKHKMINKLSRKFYNKNNNIRNYYNKILLKQEKEN